MNSPFLTVVSDRGRRLAEAPGAAQHPAAEAFLHNMASLQPQARQILDQPGWHSVELRRLAETVLESTAATTMDNWSPFSPEVACR